LNGPVAETTPSLKELLERIARLEAEIRARDERIEKLERLVEDLRRRGKRQSAPFSKGMPSLMPKAPGRKPGERYGRPVPAAIPKRIDETVRVPCPLWCFHCSGRVRLHGTGHQYLPDLPVIEEVLATPPNSGYVDELAGKLHPLAQRKAEAVSSRPSETFTS
jgi:hypothetical protein